MPDDWSEEQRQTLAESQRQIYDLKLRLTPKQPLEPTHAEKSPAPLTPERLRRRRYRIIVAMIVINGIWLANAAGALFNRRTSASFLLTREQVTVGRDTTTGEMSFYVKVPLNEFPYNLELNQKDPWELVGAASVNLALLVAILYSYRQQSKLEQRTPQPETTADAPRR